ncbi:MAG: mobilization protein [Burkholderiaceae bacterium]|nr:mobilization protein [Burkholderiaceae bacterium]
MARKTIEQKLAELDAQRAALKSRLGKQERANDTRRKVLLGALVLHRLENGKDEEFARRLRDWLKRELPDFLTRDTDKALFAELIPPAPQPAAPATTTGTTASAPAPGTAEA